MFVAIAASEIVLVHDDLNECKLAVLKRFFDSIDLNMYMPGKRYQRDGMSIWHDTWSDHTSETVRIEEWQDGARLDVLYCNLHSSIKELVTTSSISDEGLEMAVGEWRDEIAQRKVPELSILKQHTEFFVRQGKWEYALSVANIYNRGSFPRFKPNSGLALLIYAQVARCDDPGLAGEAQAQYIAARLHPVSQADIAGAEMPVVYGESIVKYAKHLVSRITHCQRPRSRSKPPSQKPIVAPIVQIRQLPRPEPRVIVRKRSKTRVRPPPQPLQPEPEVVFDTPQEAPIDPRADPQNTHDHTVSATTKVEIEALIKKHGHLQLVPLLDVSDKAKKVYDSLSDQEHSNFGISEREALALVYADIHTREHKENLEETLILRLDFRLRSWQL
ncbi:hypothetical protein JKP88DRAFT_241039 [Tribonema minus]|uniref:Uncharacterized protein n=1 Tax=Tribonema minus TaxID=303371 RepID=A0A836CHR6_9STRA|nr:hypothetical protein JKP88DRAFT_241039 [Tribonema minus]